MWTEILLSKTAARLWGRARTAVLNSVQQLNSMSAELSWPLRRNAGAYPTSCKRILYKHSSNKRKSAMWKSSLAALWGSFRTTQYSGSLLFCRAPAALLTSLGAPLCAWSVLDHEFFNSIRDAGGQQLHTCAVHQEDITTDQEHHLSRADPSELGKELPAALGCSASGSNSWFNSVGDAKNGCPQSR